MKKNKESKPLSKEEESLKSYNAKLKAEAIVKSLILGLLCGFLLSAIISVISFATVSNILWVALVVWVVATAGFTVLLYYKRYRPTEKTTAERVDEVGLEERVITMMQFKDQDNPMLKRQREDAQTALSTVTTKHVKIRFSKVLVIGLAILAAVAIFMMTYSTVLAVNAENVEEPPIEEPEISKEDKIIRDLIEALRKEIDTAKINSELRTQLHKMVNDLEASLKPTDTLEVKVAKIMDTADKIHKLIKDYLNRMTIGEELMKYDTTYELGKAIDSKDADKIGAAFEMMYDRIEPLVEQGAFGILHQTALDIDKALKDAINTPPELQKALEDLRDAYLRVFEDLEDAMKEEMPDDMQEQIHDALEEIKNAMDQAADAMKDFFEGQQEEDKALEGLDEAIQDAFQDAMDQLGQEFEYPQDNDGTNSGDKEEENNNTDTEGNGKEENNGNSSSGNGDSELRDTVIDGEQSYQDVFDNDGYRDEFQDKLESGDLSDEDRQIMQDYLDTL